MALSFELCKVYTNDCSLFKITNNTVYGSPEEDRVMGGEVLIGAHVDEEQKENFIAIDSAPFLTKLEYDISNTLDGHYKFELLRFPLYSNGTSYSPEILDINNIITTYANVVYYTNTNKFYKNISASTGITPDSINGTTYWQEITDFTIESIRKNPNIQIGLYDTIYDCRSIKCIKDELIKLGCNCSDDLKKMLPYFKKKILLDGARALVSNNDFDKAETNIRTLEKMCPKCC